LAALLAVRVKNVPHRHGLLCMRPVHDEFADRLVAAASAMKVGHALADGTQIGPVVSAGQLAENLQWMETAKQEGGEVLCGGETVSRDHDGYYMTPCGYLWHEK
jgi:aldehyde dehydrogenase (NAD+)